jgi:ribosomal-protein-alanine N-acetyltransferase
MTVRPAGAMDLDAMATLHALAFEPSWRAADLAALTAEPTAFALLAEADGAPTGFILCRIAGGEAEVLTLATAPEMRRRGIGRALLAAAIVAARTRGAEAIFLEAASDNVAALALYDGNGFSQVGVRRAYYSRPGGGADALVLRRALNTPGP